MKNIQDKIFDVLCNTWKSEIYVLICCNTTLDVQKYAHDEITYEKFMNGPYNIILTNFKSELE